MEGRSGEAATRPVPAAPLGRYCLGVVLTVTAVFSQYFVPPLLPGSRVVYGNLPGDLLVVYGVPIAAFALLVGSAPLRDWSHRMGLAVREGLAWYGVLSLVALLVLIALAIVYQAVDPSALKLLERPNPALERAQGDPWFFVGFSFVIGAVEETIFRGWIFGYWRDRPGSWVVPALWTSALFAGVHLYYATTYGLAAPLIFPQLFLGGLSFAATYRYSGGNLVMPALLHGAEDACAYLTLVSAAGATAGLAIHYGIVVAGGVLFLILWVRRREGRSESVVGPPATSL
ncbi:MAG: type II CAAX endopeptidase family protein [Thermoplasmata archaeon]|jgi:membrane protease YdiL (CAAX protease family)